MQLPAPPIGVPNPGALLTPSHIQPLNQPSHRQQAASPNLMQPGVAPIPGRTPDRPLTLAFLGQLKQLAGAENWTRAMQIAQGTGNTSGVRPKLEHILSTLRRPPQRFGP